jgi:hypothetical protein
MRLERLASSAASRTRSPASSTCSCATLEPGLVAVVGPNGPARRRSSRPPGAIFRQLPARNGADPVDYATGRDSFLELEYSIDGPAPSDRALNLDGPKRQTDALLEHRAVDGTRAPLNDGKRSTYDAAIAEAVSVVRPVHQFVFAAQGRGDEFTRRKPSQRKDLFVEFLALQHYAAMAKTAGEAAELVADARLRLEAQIEALERDTRRRDRAASSTRWPTSCRRRRRRGTRQPS